MLNESLTKFRLGVCCPCVDDGTSLVRGVGPLGAMSRQDRRLELDLAPESDGQQALTWSWIARNDALFLQRPFRPIEAHAAVLARMMQRPVWIDWDDDLCAVPLHSPYRQLYDPAELRKLMGKLISLADVVTVTTAALAEKVCEIGGIREPGDKVRILPNACHWPFSNAQRQKRITWRGGKSHNEDVLEFLPVIAELARLPQLGDWKWTFLGEPPWQVKAAIPSERLEWWADSPFMYMPAFGYLGPWVNIVPLQDSVFNRSKSNLAWIEATCAGAITLAPAWTEWQQPGVVNYQNVADFKMKLRALMERFGQPTENEVMESRSALLDGLMLDQVNAARWTIVNEFAEKTRPLIPAEACA